MPYTDQILQYLGDMQRSMKSLMIVTHDYPDPDAIASAYALQYLAREQFKVQARIVYGGALGRVENRNMVRLLRIPLHRFRRSDVDASSHIALVDTQPGFGNNSLPSGVVPDIVIDQHLPLNKSGAKLLIIDQGCGATSVLLAKSVFAAQNEMPSRLATALTYGILTDTRNLADAKRPDIISTFMETLRFADLRTLSRIVNPERSPEFIAAVGRGICGARILKKLLVSHVGQVENPDVVAYVADYLVKAKGIEVCLCSGRYGSTLRISLRTKGSAMKADRLIRQVVDDPSQAGGHGSIAGGMIRFEGRPSEKQWKEKESILARRLRTELQIPTRSRFKNAFETYRRLT